MVSELFTRRANPSRRRTSRRRVALRIEPLEDRCLLAGNPFTAAPYTPAQIRAAYGIDYTLMGNGAGQTIAIVDAYHAPNLRTDLEKFDRNLLADTSGSTSFLSVVDQNGGTSYPAYNSGWSQEIALDVEWAHAIAPAASILLVEAASNSFGNLFAAVDYAAQHASVVSMSWGSGEFSGEAAWDSHFNVAGVAFIASSGDTGGVISYPAVSPFVVGVGGTSLKLSGGTYGGETGWSGSGGGISAYESKPAYQIGITSYAMRSSPDVAYNADPGPGVAVIWNGNQYAFGGTSAGAPQWAGLVAIANQGRGTPFDSSSLLTALYSAPSTSFHDITSGKTGNGRNGNSATVGYDLVTGIGSPKANLLVPQLSGWIVPAVVPAGSPSGSGGQAGAHAEGEGFIVGVSVSASGAVKAGATYLPAIGQHPDVRFLAVRAQDFPAPNPNSSSTPLAPSRSGVHAAPVYTPAEQCFINATASSTLTDVPPRAPSANLVDDAPVESAEDTLAEPVVGDVNRIPSESETDAPAIAGDALETTLSNAVWVAAMMACFAQGAPARQDGRVALEKKEKVRSLLQN